MRSVWTQSARPRLHCSGLTRNDSLSSILTRRTTSTPPRPRLTFQDAFTVLLGPVLAAAVIVDTSWKDKRRRDWDEKIAQVVAEVDAIRIREQQAWSALQHRSIRLGAQQQRRHYATAAQAIAIDSEEEVLAPEWDFQEDPKYQDPGDDAKSIYGPEEVGTGHPTRALQHLQRLVAVKLAIHLLLHVQSGASAQYDDIESIGGVDPDVPTHIVALMRKLREVRGRLQSIRKDHVAMIHIEAASNTVVSRRSQEQYRLDKQIQQLSLDLNEQRIGIRAYIDKISYHIMQSSEAPSPRGYVAMLKTLSHNEFSAMCGRVVAAIEEQGPAQLDSESLHAIIWQYGKLQDAYNFDRLLRRLTKARSWTGDERRWEWWRVNSVAVAVPVSLDARLLQGLVYASLHCQQLGRAQAWATVYNDSSDAKQYRVFIINNFLRYASSALDWKLGKVWLRQAQVWAAELWDVGQLNLQRVILAMLDLCVACGQRELYAKIMNAATQSGIGAYELDSTRKRLVTRRTVAILHEWQLLFEMQLHDYSPPLDPGKDFQHRLEDTFKGLEPLEGTASPRPSGEVASKEEGKVTTILETPDAEIRELKVEWHSMREAQHADLSLLHNEINRLKAAFASISTNTEEPYQASPRGVHDPMREELKALRADLDHTLLHFHAKTSLGPQLSALKVEVERSRQQLLSQQEMGEELKALRAELAATRSQHQAEGTEKHAKPQAELVEHEVNSASKRRHQRQRQRRRMAEQGERLPAQPIDMMENDPQRLSQPAVEGFPRSELVNAPEDGGLTFSSAPAEVDPVEATPVHKVIAVPSNRFRKIYTDELTTPSLQD